MKRTHTPAPPKVPEMPKARREHVPDSPWSDEADDLSLGPTGSDGAITDPDIARVFKEEQIGHGERSGREHAWRNLRAHTGFDPDLRAGDVDAVLEDVEFVGEEAPGGSTPTPDQSDVDDIGRAMGVHFQDNEPLDMEEKITRRDDARWELDPASSEDYAERERDREGKRR